MQFEEKVKELKIADGFFSTLSPIFISRAPGRLDLMGGNDDYTGGLVFESTIREATHAAAQLTEGRSVILKNKNVSEAGGQGELSVSLDDLHDEESIRQIASRSPGLNWTAYVLGNIHYLIKNYPDRIQKGLRLYMESSVPFNRGVSSSAAIEVAVMKASAAAYGIELSGIRLAVACQWVENVLAGSACGIMDQIAVVTGRQGFIMPLVCQPCNPEPLIQLPEKLNIWGIDSGVSHQVSGIEYEAARAAAFMGYKMICDHEDIAVIPDEHSPIPRFTDARWNGYLANLPPSLFYDKYQYLLPEHTSRQQFLEQHQVHPDPFTPLKDEVVYNVLANTRYAVEENHRVQLFAEISRGASAIPTARAFGLMGELMYQSHYAYTDCGLGAIATDILVNLCRKKGVANGIYGAKITGGGAGGTVAILANADAGDAIRQIFLEYAEAQPVSPFLFEGSSDGADSYGIKIIE
jgi:galactokinase